MINTNENRGGKMKARYYSLILILIFFSFLLGCGGAGGNSAPPGSTITINPSSVSTTDSSSSSTWRTQFFTITLIDSDGNPIDNAKITISTVFTTAPDTTSAVIQLYDGSSTKSSPFEAYTDRFGVYYLRFDYRTGESLTYGGNLEVRSGDAYATATFSITGG